VYRVATTMAAAWALTWSGGCRFSGASVAGAAAELDRMTLEAGTLDGAEIHALRGGSPGDPRVIYIHGTPGNSTNFSRYVADPVEGLEAVAVDRPGFGRSRPRGSVERLSDQAAAIEPFLVEREGRWPILVGHSLGAPIAAWVAAEHPGRVGGLVLVAGSLDPELEEVLLIQHVGNFAFMPLLLPRWARNANRELICLEPELRALSDQLDRVRCPVVIVHGTADRLVPYENVAYARTRLGDEVMEVVTLVGADHFLPWRFEDVIRRSVETLRDLE